MFALPSFFEGTPRCVTEAMASAVPVVASRVAGVPDLVQDGKTGYFTDPGNSDQLAERVTELLKNRKLWKSMSKNSEKHADNFSVENLQRGVAEVYQTLFEEKRYS